MNPNDIRLRMDIALVQQDFIELGYLREVGNDMVEVTERGLTISDDEMLAEMRALERNRRR